MAPRRNRARGRKSNEASNKRVAKPDDLLVARLATAPERDEYFQELTDPDKVLACVVGCLSGSSEGAARLRSPKLHIRQDDPGSIYAYTIALADEPAVQVGLGLHPFLRHYVRAALVYLASRAGGDNDAKKVWPAARQALATTTEWLSLGGEELHLPDFAVSQRTELLAEHTSALAYRFLICHELAHVALGHLASGETLVATMGDNDIRRLRASQQNEIDADTSGVRLHVTSFLNTFGNDQGLRTHALVGAMWGLCAMNLLLGHLMVLGSFVDERRWKISLSHPPDMQRFFFFLGAATAIAGDDIRRQLDKQRADLCEFNLVIWNESDDRRRAVESVLSTLLGQEACRGASSETVRTTFDELLEQSPVGLLRTLEHWPKSDQLSGLASMLPAELLSTLQQSPSERADKMNMQ